MSSFDLNSLSELSVAQETGIDVPITHPKTGAPLGIVVKVAGPDSERQEKARDAMVDERITGTVRHVTAARLKEEGAKVTARSIISWSGVVDNGKTIEFSVENALMIFAKYKFIREQIERAAENRANFIKT